MNLASHVRRSPFVFPIAVAVALAMLILSESSYWRSRGEMEELVELISARPKVQRMLLSITDAETGQRGYLLTGRTEYLEPFRNAAESLPETLEWLRAHYARRPELRPAMAKLEELVADKMSEVSDTVRLYDEGRHEAWRAVLQTNIGQERMDAIRAQVEQLLADEAKAGELARRQVHDSLLISRLGIATLTALSLLALFLYLRQTRALEATRREQQQAVQAERDQLEVEVQRRTAELTELSRHLLSAREDERSRLARELHDELGALLTTAKLDSARIRTRVAALSPEAAERLDHLNDTLNRGIALKRRIIEDLRPSSLSNLGLVAALEILLREFEQSAEIEVHAELRPVPLRPDSELTVYRLVQEALTNVSKYARARSVRVSLAVQDGMAEVAVADDGVGFDTRQQKSSAHGLLGMRYRVEAAGGLLKLQSAPGRGTRVGATLPLAPAP
ncbi:CHASE3 domain-containing protein [Rivibacter subsaxonicus]|uniref:histidine kinase n=1 Tax=Rivibacter subsaxonicus TaxID=457575 RepID=A0A4Q7VN38_9BURK|nr:CHASE3 domain-containing protein [Rivibacter subsaxonicus]RZT97760.1 signal transduction histidine kinase [Rivibacter subsaxonicus]